MTKVIKWKCSECDKVLESLYHKQLDFLISQHKYMHEHKKKGEQNASNSNN
jgi:hypothetical protein